MRLIDADAYIEQYCSENCGHEFCDHPKCYDYTVNTLLEFPTIDRVKHGHWIDAKGDECRFWIMYADDYYQCSCCGEKSWSNGKDKFCRNCGAYMRGDST